MEQDVLTSGRRVAWTARLGPSSGDILFGGRAPAVHLRRTGPGAYAVFHYCTEGDPDGRAHVSQMAVVRALLSLPGVRRVVIGGYVYGCVTANGEGGA